MDFLEAIRRESALFYDVAEGAHPAAAVTSCPGWSIADLTWHLGEVHWFWATIIEERAADPEAVERLKPARPSDFGELVSWGRSQAVHLLSALSATADDVPVWTWALAESDHTVGFIRRHQVQEAAVHRWDMQSAAGLVPAPVAPDAAADSLDELLAITLPWCIRGDKPIGGSVHIHCTDVEGEWLVSPEGRVERGHHKGDAAMRGTASDLLLALFKRVPLDRIEVVGDAAVARQFAEAMSTE